MSQQIMDLVESAYLKSKAPSIRIGDTVDVRTRILEGDKERIQTFNGVVIARRGRGLNENITVRRIVGKQGVERVFMLHSPNVLDVISRRHGKARRAKLYFLRDRVGKARRLREVRLTRGRAADAFEQATEAGDAERELVGAS
ncbi:MAG: 50S ribosomal protein L19 [Phycisphaerales bacterium]|nr:MAG: 50S ribosomal protein L19 [Phycisphaerales bacterium]